MSKSLLFYVLISAFGLFTTLMLALNMTTSLEEFPWRKPVVGSIFTLICLFGIAATIMPKKCSTPAHFKRRGQTRIKGHHPDCEAFAPHLIRVRGRTLCAACSGLALGAMTASSGTFLYFFADLEIGCMGFPLVLAGVASVVFGFSELRFRGTVRLLLNTLFVLGACLILAGIDTLVQSLSIDLFVLVLILFWLATRIQLSQWDHSRICRGCRLSCPIEGVSVSSA